MGKNLNFFLKTRDAMGGFRERMDRNSRILTIVNITIYVCVYTHIYCI